jgi:hypothetical protein
MSRREIVLLVSRAIAAQIIIIALNDLLVFLRLWVLIFSQQMRNNIWTDLAFNFAHIVFQFLIAALFWRCGPLIERFLLPAASERSEESA